eukprot:9006903-Karenia_brevis.AAC.1
MQDNKTHMDEHDAAIKDLVDLINQFHIGIDAPVRLHMKTPEDAFDDFRPKMVKVSNLLHVPSFVSEEHAST